MVTRPDLTILTVWAHGTREYCRGPFARMLDACTASLEQSGISVEHVTVDDCGTDVARGVQSGSKRATGKYLGLASSDDWRDPDYFTRLMEASVWGFTDTVTVDRQGDALARFERRWHRACVLHQVARQCSTIGWNLFSGILETETFVRIGYPHGKAVKNSRTKHIMFEADWLFTSAVNRVVKPLALESPQSCIVHVTHGENSQDYCQNHRERDTGELYASLPTECQRHMESIRLGQGR